MFKWCLLVNYNLCPFQKVVKALKHIVTMYFVDKKV